MQAFKATFPCSDSRQLTSAEENGTEKERYHTPAVLFASYDLAEVGQSVDYGKVSPVGSKEGALDWSVVISLIWAI